MRIALVTEQLLVPVPGGIGRYAAELGAALARTASDGDEITGWSAWHRDLRAARVRGVAGPRRLALPRRGLAAAWERGRGPRPRGADVVHAPSLLAPPGLGASDVVTIHDTVPWTHPETLNPRGARWHVAMAERVARSGAAVVTPSHVVADELARVLPQLGAERVHVLGEGVSPALLTEPDRARTAAVRAARHLPERYLLSLATLEPRKGLDVLVQALAEFGADAPPLLVVGPRGWGGVDVAHTVREAGLPDDAVRALGRIPDADLAVVLRGALALVAPSRAEGFGLPVAEAMAVGTPVVCSDAPALVEVGGDAARVVPRGDASALALALADVSEPGAVGAALRERMIAAGRARAVAWDWDAVARRTWELYRTLA